MPASNNCTNSTSDSSGDGVIYHFCLTPSQRTGLAIVSSAGFMSLLSLAVLTGLIVRNIVRYRRQHPGCRWNLVRRPPDAYVISLCCADALQAVGTIMDVRWVHNGVVKVGSYCRAQGALQQTGETAVAFATMSIALHTFVVMWFHKGQLNLTAAYCVIATTWLFVILFVIISAATTRNYFTPDTYWCWVGAQQSLLGDKIGGEYAWLWLTLLVSLVVYVPLYLRRLGYLNFDKWARHAQQPEENISHIRQPKVAAKSLKPSTSSFALLAYPVAYTIVVLPVSIARWATFTGHSIPDAATFFSVFLHDSFGLVNVILLLTTRHGLLMFEDQKSRAQSFPSTPSEWRTPAVLFPQKVSVTRTVDITRDPDRRNSDKESVDTELEDWDKIHSDQSI